MSNRIQAALRDADDRKTGRTMSEDDTTARAPRGFDSDVDVATAGRTIALLYLAGSTIGLISMVTPHSARANDFALYTNIALAYVAGAILMALGRRVRGWMIHLVMAAGPLVIARAIHYSGEPVSFYSTWFIWIGLVAFYFFRRPVAAAYTAYASAVYALTLVDMPSSAPVARWLTTVTTLFVAGILISTLLTRARASAQRMARTAEMAHALARLSDPDAARPEICAAALRLTGATGAALLERGEVSGQPEAVAAAGTDAPDRAGPAQRAFATGEPVEDARCVWQPVLRDGTPVAVLALRWPRGAEPACDLVALLAVEASVTLERLDVLGRLERSARTDELTGLPNRRAWQEALGRELSRARRDGAQLCVAMLDIDRFKRFNDERGHLAGDVLLKATAVAWSSRLRPSDLLARFGGEEFTLAMPGCTVEEANALVERLREAMPKEQTCSAGIALWDGREDARRLLDRADRALYRAKELGRDRTELAAAA